MSKEPSKKERERKESTAPWGTKDTTLRETFTNQQDIRTQPATWGTKDTKLRESRELGKN